MSNFSQNFEVFKTLSYARSKLSATVDDNVPIVGIIASDSIPNASQLACTGAKPKLLTITAPIENVDTNHTHLLLVDHGARELRNNLEKLISNTNPISVVNIFFTGTLVDLAQLVNRLLQNQIAVVISGSGGAADFVADCWNLFQLKARKFTLERNSKINHPLVGHMLAPDERLKITLEITDNDLLALCRKNSLTS